MRIAHINTFFSSGGTAHVMGGIVAAARAAGHECLVAAARGDMLRGVDCYRIGSHAGVWLNAASARISDNDGFLARRATRQLISRLEAFAPDVVHLHNLHGYYINSELLFSYLRRSGCRVVWTLHDCWAMTGHCARFSALGCNEWERGCRECRHKGEYPRSVGACRSAQNFDAKKRTFCGVANLRITTPSQWLARLVKKSYLRGYDVTVVPNGVDLSRFAPREGSFRERYGIGSRTMLLGVASVWLQIKGLDDFIALASMLGDEYAIVMVGVDSRLRRRLPHRIIALPQLADCGELAEAYAAADLLLNLSHEETFGLVTLESLACGTPVLVYDVTACPEPLMPCTGESAQAVCGVVVDPRSGVAGVKDAIESGAWRNVSAGECVAHASHFDASVQYATFLGIYSS